MIQAPGGSMVPKHVLWLLFSKKITKMLKTQQPLKLEKNKHRFGILRNFEFFWCVWLNLKTIKFNLIKLAT
jgi:hypothetical protein